MTQGRRFKFWHCLRKVETRKHRRANRTYQSLYFDTWQIELILSDLLQPPPTVREKVRTLRCTSKQIHSSQQRLHLWQRHHSCHTIWASQHEWYHSIRIISGKDIIPAAQLELHNMNGIIHSESSSAKNHTCHTIWAMQYEWLFTQNHIQQRIIPATQLELHNMNGIIHSESHLAVFLSNWGSMLVTSEC
jgi:hypothetical protein